MKKIIALCLALVLVLSGCATKDTEQDKTTNTTDSYVEKSIDDYSFSGLDDPTLLQYMEDSIYSDLSLTLANDDYIINSVQAIYVSKEYIEEVSYNSQTNLFFGYSLAELDEYFGNSKYVFTVGDNGQTVVRKQETISDEYKEQLLKNVIIGTGVIVVCVVISVASEGAGAPAAAAIFATSAKTGAIAALSGAAISGASAGIIKGYETGDFDQALKAAALAGSEGYKWGAIGGAISGGVSEAITLKAASTAQAAQQAIPTARESELAALSKFGGEEQVSFLNGQEVPWGTPNATRPDVVRKIGDTLEAIEVKNYNLETNVNQLCTELRRQIGQRVVDMPAGTTQRVVLDVTGRGYSESLVESVIMKIQTTCADVYPNLPVEIMGALG